MREDGEDRGVQGKRHHQAAQVRPQIGGHRRQTKNQRGCDHDPHRQITGWPCRHPVRKLLASRHQEEGQDEAPDNQDGLDDRRHARETEEVGGGAEGCGPREQPQRPAGCPPAPNVRQRKHGLRGDAQDHAERRVGSKMAALIERQEEDHRPGGQRKSHQPTAQRVTPAASDQGGGGDQRRGDNHLEQQAAQRPVV